MSVKLVSNAGLKGLGRKCVVSCHVSARPPFPRRVVSGHLGTVPALVLGEEWGVSQGGRMGGSLNATGFRQDSSHRQKPDLPKFGVLRVLL